MRNIRVLVGLVLLAAGVGLAVWGVIALNQASESLGGALGRLVGRQTESQTRAIAITVAGAVLAVLGLALLALRGAVRSRRNRR